MINPSHLYRMGGHSFGFAAIEGTSELTLEEGLTGLVQRLPELGLVPVAQYELDSPGAYTQVRNLSNPTHDQAMVGVFAPSPASMHVSKANSPFPNYVQITCFGLDRMPRVLVENMAGGLGLNSVPTSKKVSRALIQDYRTLAWRIDPVIRTDRKTGAVIFGVSIIQSLRELEEWPEDRRHEEFIV